MKKPETRTILAAISAIGVVATAVVAIFDGMKVKDVLDNAEAGIGKDELKKEVVKKCIPTAVAATGTIVAGVLSFKASAAIIASLTGTVGYLAYNRKALERNLENAIGRENLDVVKRKITSEYHKEIQDRLPKKKKFPAEETGYGDLLCQERYFGRWFRCSKEHVDEAIRAFTLAYEKAEEEHASVDYNDFYELLGLEGTIAGRYTGWTPGVELFAPSIEFTTEMLEDGWNDIHEPIYVIDLVNEDYYPNPCYWEV